MKRNFGVGLRFNGPCTMLPILRGLQETPNRCTSWAPDLERWLQSSSWGSPEPLPLHSLQGGRLQRFAAQWAAPSATHLLALPYVLASAADSTSVPLH